MSLINCADITGIPRPVPEYETEIKAILSVPSVAAVMPAYEHETEWTKQVTFWDSLYIFLSILLSLSLSITFSPLPNYFYSSLFAFSLSLSISSLSIYLSLYFPYFYSLDLSLTLYSYGYRWHLTAFGLTRPRRSWRGALMRRALVTAQGGVELCGKCVHSCRHPSLW